MTKKQRIAAARHAAKARWAQVRVAKLGAALVAIAPEVYKRQGPISTILDRKPRKSPAGA